MRNWLICFLILACFASCSSNPVSVNVIFDTDIGPDYDDVGALAMLHALADKGEAKILATISCNAAETTVPTLSVINTYFNRGDVPVGVLKKEKPDHPCERGWAQAIIEKYPHSVRSRNDAMEAVKLYRKVLASQPDKSVTIITVGFLTNLADLLMSPPDEHANLHGYDLVAKKVKQLVAMAGSIDSSGTGGYEFNVMADVPASQIVFKDWPTPIILSGLEIGVDIFTGIRLITDPAILNSPVKDAYQIAITYDGTKVGRYSWDQTAVLVGVRGIDPYFDSRKLDFAIGDDGKNTVMAGDRISYLTRKQDPEQLSKIIEELMMHVPGKH